MAVAHDTAAVASGVGIADGGTITTTLTIGSNTNRLVYGGVTWTDTSNLGASVSAVTFGGSAMTFVGTVGVTQVDDSYYFIAPSTGSQSMVTTFSGADITVNCVQGVESMYNVHQTTPLGNSNTNSGLDKTPTVTVANCSVDSMVVDTVIYPNGAQTLTLTVGANQTQRWNSSVGAGSSRFRGAGSTEPVTVAGSIVMSWTATITTAVEWVTQAVEFIVVAVAADTPQRTLTGVGT